MKLKVVVVDLELSRRTKRAIAIAAFIAGGSALAYATVPNTFHSGDPLSSANMNANFASLDTRITAIETKFVETKNGKKFSVGATFCGTTTTVTNGQITGGYAGAKSLCEAVAGCGSSLSAHMCTADEVVRSLAAGIASPTAATWYSTGAYLQLSTSSGSDCIGWTDDGANGAVGPVWGSAANVGIVYADCSQQNPVSCCD